MKFQIIIRLKEHYEWMNSKLKFQSKSKILLYFIFYHEHEQQQHQQRQHGLCDWGRFSGCPPIVDVPPCVATVLLLLPPPPLPCDEPRSLQLDRCNSVTLHDIVCKADPILVQHFRWIRWTTLTLCSTKIEAFSRKTLIFDRMMKMN